jgi:hypothetical protein
LSSPCYEHLAGRKRRPFTDLLVSILMSPRGRCAGTRGLFKLYIRQIEGNDFRDIFKAFKSFAAFAVGDRGHAASYANSIVLIGPFFEINLDDERTNVRILSIHDLFPT